MPIFFGDFWPDSFRREHHLKSPNHSGQCRERAVSLQGEIANVGTIRAAIRSNELFSFERNIDFAFLENDRFAVARLSFSIGAGISAREAEVSLHQRLS